ncbi:MAG: 5'-nucleotidase C-terminal domain-containing protein [Fimbriimonadales bacterium]|nr:5'-nucleotidase C-terminal domain-containing protein [Fimbriimonadales bacterium]
MRVWLVISLLGLVLTNTVAQTVQLSKAVSMETVGAGSNPIAQTIVEAMRSATGAELAMLGAAFFDETAQFPAGSLSADAFLKAVRYPDDEVVVLSLTGEQLLQALERATELYPQKNNAFLQLTGAEVRFDPKAAPGKRIQSVFISGAKLDPKRTYRVATTAPLARGALGYFRIWSKEQISTSTGRSLAEVVRDYLQRPRSLISEPAWVAQ